MTHDLQCIVGLGCDQVQVFAGRSAATTLAAGDVQPPDRLAAADEELGDRLCVNAATAAGRSADTSADIRPGRGVVDRQTGGPESLHLVS